MPRTIAKICVDEAIVIAALLVRTMMVAPESVAGDPSQKTSMSEGATAVQPAQVFKLRIYTAAVGFFSFRTARRTILGYEVMNILRKGQVAGVVKGDIQGQVRFVESLFGVAA